MSLALCTLLVTLTTVYTHGRATAVVVRVGECPGVRVVLRATPPAHRPLVCRRPL